jgi:hypothetical protein
MLINSAASWRYITKCTIPVASNSLNYETSNINSNNKKLPSSSIVDDFDKEDDLVESYEMRSTASLSSSIPDFEKLLRLKCPNINDFLFIGQTQYGVSSQFSKSSKKQCQLSSNDCLISVDYIANQCNGLNSCDIQLDAQFLHSCKNHSDYINLAYECIPGSKRLDICSNDETFIVDSHWSTSETVSLNSRFGSFYLTSPSYPNEYASNLNKCQCKLEYVKLDTNNNNNQEKNQDESEKQQKLDEMNLVFKAYEFDLEESDQESSNTENNKCSKDKLRIESTTDNLKKEGWSSIDLCGQHKDFKEFYAKGSKLTLDFQTDDAISRRGFLLKIEPTTETECPHGSKRFDAQKCIKYFGDERPSSSMKLNFYDAIRSCQALNGRLLTINDFVDNLKLNSIIRQRISEKIHKNLNIVLNSTLYSTHFERFNIAYWSNNLKQDERNNKQSNLIKKQKCLTKKINVWQEEESCQAKRAYICEFDPIKINKNNVNKKPVHSLNNGNRLIRVACGSSSRQFVVKQSTETTITTTTTTTTTESTTKTSQPTSKVLPVLSDIKNPDYYLVEEDGGISTTTTKKARFASKTVLKQDVSEVVEDKKFFLNLDLMVIIAIVCGASLVLILINVFCIWNYYNKKLNGLKKAVNPYDQRTSTLLRSSTKTSRSSRTISTTYGKVPTYVDVVQGSGHGESSSASLLLGPSNNSSPNSTANIIKLDKESYLKAFLQLAQNSTSHQQDSQQLQHFYETLYKNNQNNQWHNYAEVVGASLSSSSTNSQFPQFDSVVVLPASQLNQMPVNSTVLLIKPNNNNMLVQKQHPDNNEEQYSSVVYGDLTTTNMPMSSSQSISSDTNSNQHLITFSNSSTASTATNSSSDI